MARHGAGQLEALYLRGGQGKGRARPRHGACVGVLRDLTPAALGHGVLRAPARHQALPAGTLETAASGPSEKFSGAAGCGGRAGLPAGSPDHRLSASSRLPGVLQVPAVGGVSGLEWSQSDSSVRSAATSAMGWSSLMW